MFAVIEIHQNGYKEENIYSRRLSADVSVISGRLDASPG